jgi:hypothetical protein
MYNVALRAWGGQQHCRLRDGTGLTASRARGGRRRCGPREGEGHRCPVLRNDAGCTASQAQGGQHCCGLGNSVAGLGTRPTLSMAPPTWVGEDGGA